MRLEQPASCLLHTVAILNAAIEPELPTETNYHFYHSTKVSYIVSLSLSLLHAAPLRHDIRKKFPKFLTFFFLEAMLANFFVDFILKLKLIPTFFMLMNLTFKRFSQSS